jgi:soluble lytic murein transglycosylase-like protein
VRVAGSGGDAAGFASDFLGGLMEEANPFAGKAEAGGKADKANKADNTNTTGNTSQGDKPDNGWVQSLGASDVDPTQAQGLRPGSSLQGLRVSGDALSGWGDEIDGGIALNGSMAPEARTTGEAVVGKGQGPLAALAAAGLSTQEQQAAYGQLLASGQVRLNAQGVPMVQPGQVLRFDLSDTSAAQLGGRAIAAESGGRAQRDAAAAANTNNAGGGRGFVNPAPASEYGNYPFAGRSTITDPSAYVDPQPLPVISGSNLADRRNYVTKGGGAIFDIAPTPSAKFTAPAFEINAFNSIDKYAPQVTAAAMKYRVDPDLIRSVMYMEQTHGYYDLLLQPFDKNRTILPMNVHDKLWGDFAGTRQQLLNPAHNIEAGAKILAGIQANLAPQDRTVDKISTLYNKLGATQVTDYGARVNAIYVTKPWIAKP